MIETLESRQFLSVTPLATSAPLQPVATTTASRPQSIVVVQPASQPVQPNVVIAIIAILIG